MRQPRSPAGDKLPYTQPSRPLSPFGTACHSLASGSPFGTVELGLEVPWSLLTATALNPDMEGGLAFTGQPFQA